MGTRRGSRGEPVWRTVRQTARATALVARTTREAVDELFPPIVAEAERDGKWRPDEPGRYCPRCGASTGPGAADADGCAFCHDESLPWRRMTRLGAYVPPLDERIRAMKFGRQWRWATWFGEQLAAALPAPDSDGDARIVVCPVPMHWLRRWSRGFNQSSLMAAALAKGRGWTFAPVLRRTRHRPPQTRVVPSQRQQNVRGSIVAEAVDLGGCDAILVDDVKTSGATLRLCARLLRERGARHVDCAVAAVADPRGGDFTRIDPPG